MKARFALFLLFALALSAARPASAEEGPFPFKKPDVSSLDDHTEYRVMFEIARGGRPLTLPEAAQVLEGTGVKLDFRYQPIPMYRVARYPEPADTYVVRGQGTGAQLKAANRIANVAIWMDAVIGPLQ